MCKASSDISSLLCTNSGPDAGWRRTRISHSSYLAVLAATGCAAPVLMAIVFGFRLECVMVDVLQKVDFGAASHIIGNVLWLRAVKRRISSGDTMKARVESLQQHLNEWYRPTKCTCRVQGQITVDTLRSDGLWPKLRAKAAATRHLAPFTLMIIEEQMDGSVHDREAVAVSKLLVVFTHSSSTNP